MNSDIATLAARAQNLADELKALLNAPKPEPQPAPARPPLPDLSGWPGYAFKVEGGQEAWRPVYPGERSLLDGEIPSLRGGAVPSAGPRWILTYTPPPDVPENERWWDAEERKWWTVDGAYCFGRKPTPTGKELTGWFRPMEPGEECLGIDGDVWKYPKLPGAPRLILRPKPQPRELHLIECREGERVVCRIDGVYYKRAEGR